MRHSLAGIVLLLLLLPGNLLAQIRGGVESIGFGSFYRPDTWTPMVVQLRTAGLEAKLHNLQVIVEDLDRDREVFSRPISVDPSQTDQRFWMYFIPPPTGLVNADLPAPAIDQVRKKIRVQITTANNKPVGQFSLPDVPLSLDVDRNTGEAKRRGTKLVLVVTDGNASPAVREYNPALGTVGTMEDVEFVTVRPSGLPESALAYESVDAILWLNADANQLDEGGARRTDAIEHYVRSGGRLVVCQPFERDRLNPLASLLPIEYSAGLGLYRLEMKESPDLLPLRDIVEKPSNRNIWAAVKGPFRMAAAAPKPNALVDDRYTITWPDKTTSPWIVRGVHGLGGVTWVAQDLGDPALTARTSTAGWVHAWDEIFAWNNDSHTATERGDNDRGYSDSSRAVDLGYSLLEGMKHPGRGTAMVLIAVVFFIFYWLAAGPGSYFALINWRKKELSWVAFAGAALVATVLTMLVVRVTLRGDPDVKHVTVVQSAPGQPAVARSNIGLYIPNDGSIPVTVEKTTAGSLSGVTAFPEHPFQRRSDAELPPVQGEYVVPIPDETGEKAPVVNFPYRSTLKKVQAKWVGDLPGRVDGSAKLSSNLLRGAEGLLTNSTGVDLREVYVAFLNVNNQPRILYREKWAKGTTLDFARDVTQPPIQVAEPGVDYDAKQRLVRAVPNDGRANKWPIIDTIGDGRATNAWTGWWYSNFRSISSNVGGPVAFDDSRDHFVRSLPVMALFDLLPTSRDPNNQKFLRFEFLRRGVRNLNLSHVVTNGQMLVLAVGIDKQPLPYPFMVDGDAYGGEGDVLYQFVVPLDRSKPEPAATTSPTTAPAP